MLLDERIHSRGSRAAINTTPEHSLRKSLSRRTQNTVKGNCNEMPKPFNRTVVHKFKSRDQTTSVGFEFDHSVY